MCKTIVVGKHTWQDLRALDKSSARWCRPNCRMRVQDLGHMIPGDIIEGPPTDVGLLAIKEHAGVVGRSKVQKLCGRLWIGSAVTGTMGEKRLLQLSVFIFGKLEREFVFQTSNSVVLCSHSSSGQALTRMRSTSGHFVVGHDRWTSHYNQSAGGRRIWI